MSDQERNSKNDIDLERLKYAYRKRTTEREKCLSSDLLVRYHQRTLSGEEMLLIKQHLDVCGVCDWAVTQLIEFDSVGIDQKQKESVRARLIRFFLHPVVAYGIALTLLYPAYRGIFPVRPAMEKSTKVADSARDFNLGVGSSLRSIPVIAEVPIALSASERFFILTFYVPVSGDYSYEMEMANVQGKILESGEIQSRDSVGNFSIVANSSFFSDGHYNLKVKEIERRTKEVKDQYLFRFRIERSATN